MLFIPVDGTHLAKPWVAVGLWCFDTGWSCLVGLVVAVRCGVTVSVASSCSASRLCTKRLHINPIPTYTLELSIFYEQAVNELNSTCVGPGLELKGCSRSKATGFLQAIRY
jgi:hypothetical protein